MPRRAWNLLLRSSQLSRKVPPVRFREANRPEPQGGRPVCAGFLAPYGEATVARGSGAAHCAFPGRFRIRTLPWIQLYSALISSSLLHHDYVPFVFCIDS